VAASPELIAPGVYRVDAGRPSNLINVLLLENDDGWTLVDTGTRNSVGRIKGAIEALGSGPEDLKRIFLTHQHDDHTGGLRDLLEWAPDAEAGASPHEAEVISGRREKDRFANPLLNRIARNVMLPAAPVRKVLREGDLVSGFRVISTLGHTLGHVSLLRDEDGLLFTGDAFGRMPRRLRVGIRKAVCADPLLAKRSAERLLAEDFRTVVFAHGKTLREGAWERLREVAARCRY